MRVSGTITALLFVACLLAACSSTSPERVVTVVAQDFKFTVDDTIPSGWNHFEFKNSGHTVHFFLLNKLPDGVSYEQYTEKVTRGFQVAFDSVRAGAGQQRGIEILLQTVPGWFFSEVKQFGGSGLLTNGKSTDVYLNLPAGTYVMECYIKEQGVFHSTTGMISKLVVSAEQSTTQPPMADLQVSLSNFKIETQGVFHRGKNTVAVKFLEHPEVGLGNDLHIFKVTGDSTIAKVVPWLNWLNLEGLQSPAPAEFLGGVQEMPAGETAYFTVTLDSGNYALVAEPQASNGMIEEFSIE